MNDEVNFSFLASPVKVRWVGAPQWLAPLAAGSIQEPAEPGVVYFHLQLGRKLKPWTTSDSRRAQSDDTED